MDSSRYAGMSSWCDVDERRLTDFIMGQLIKTFTDCYYCIFILSLSIFPPTTICTDCDLSTINKDGDDDDDDDEILVENRNFYNPVHSTSPLSYRLVWKTRMVWLPNGEKRLMT